jgi:hypothetical protein
MPVIADSPPAKAPAAPDAAQRALPRECVIKPVMTEEDLRACAR